MIFSFISKGENKKPEIFKWSGLKVTYVVSVLSKRFVDLKLVVFGFNGLEFLSDLIE